MTFVNHSGRSKTVEEEPEWLAHGPTSQFDTIELKGFDQEDNRRRQGILGTVNSCEQGSTLLYWSQWLHVRDQALACKQFLVS